MQASESNRTYTAADIEHYHNGSMPPAEMHALEKAALDDPFLADALDGYTHTPTPMEDVTLLKERLQRRTSKVVALLHHRHRLAWRAAAVLILLIGSGWLAFYFISPAQYTIANRREAAPRTEPQAMPPAPADSVRTAPAETDASREADESANISTATTAPSESKDVAVAKGTRPQRSIENTEVEVAMDETASETAAVSKPQTNSKAHAEDAPALEQARGTAAQQLSTNKFKARVIDSAGNPVPFATVTDMKQDRNVVLADPEGAFLIMAPDSTLMVLVSATGFQAIRKKLRTDDTTATVALPRSGEQLSEVVVTALGRKAAQSRVRLEAAELRGSRKRFDTYAEESIEWPGGWEGRLDENEVTLAFDVDKEGNAVDITVEKSLCAACDSTAVRLIRDGAKWRKTTKDRKAKAYIRF